MGKAGVAGRAWAMSFMLAPLLGMLIGLALGMLGGGGSILTVPILVYILRQDPHIAVATSLMIVGMNALIGTWLHYRAGRVRMKPALLFGATGILAAFGGARLSKLISGPVLLISFALLMLVVATLMLRSSHNTTTALPSQPVVWWRMVLGGMGVGFLTGFLGVGGGFLIVPALVLLLGMEMADAVGSSLVVIALNSAAGLLGQLNGTTLPWTLIGVFVIAGIVGLQLGARATKNLSPTRLRQSFAIFVLGLAVVLLAINIPVVLAT